MDNEKEGLSTFLAYTKSPKISKRTSFQDELKKAINARVSRQLAVEDSDSDGSDYSEEFESDDSLNESYGKTQTIQSKVEKTLNDFHFSDDEDSSGKLSFLKNRKDTDRNISKGSNNSVTTDDIKKGDYKYGMSKSPEDKQNPPTPKPRGSRINREPSHQGINASVSEENFKPLPQQRKLARTSSQLEDKAEAKDFNNRLASLSAPSSLTRINDKVPPSETQSFSERCSPEGYRLASSPSTVSQFKSLSISGDENNITIPMQAKPKDLQVEAVAGPRSTEPGSSGRTSPSAFELMIMDVKERSINQKKKDPVFVEHNEDPVSREHNDDGLRQENGKQKHDPQKNTEETSELGRSKSSSNRSFSATYIKKRSPKKSNLTSPKSRYLGTLTILDKSFNDNNCEVDAADTVRAAVYQNWLEKKKVYLHELQQMKKTQVEQEKEKIKMEGSMKKEEAMAAFMAWKSEKKKAVKEIQMKQKMEQKKKMDEVQEIAQKKDECRKAFEKWKERKEEYLQQKSLKEKMTETEKKRLQQTALMEKKNINMSAFKTWNERKEHVLYEKKKQEMHEKLKLKKIKAEKEDQEKRAMEMYEEWLKRKERQEVTEKKQKKLQVILDNDPPPPWSPPGATIPGGR